jgi:hypothetical protein
MPEPEPSPAAGPPVSWAEPTSLVALRWGAYRSRLAGGLLLIVSGGFAIAGASASSPFAQALLGLGTAAHVTGWSVLPSAGWRRIWAMLASTVAMWFLLTGPGWLAILVLPYLGWLLVRRRPVASYATALFVLAAATMVARVFPEYAGMLAALGIVAAVMVVSALLARAVHVAQWRLRHGRPRGEPLRRGRKPSIRGV